MIITEPMLGRKLNEMYSNAPKNEKVIMIHLFGLKFADIIRGNGYSVREIVKYAKINDSYVVEVNKGINMAKYARIKDNIDTFDIVDTQVI
ncbi:MAG: hypothetical protein ACI4MH_06465 [Candidatus Coproplasma sp.]